MTPEELQHLRALCEKATAGEWKTDGPRVCDGVCGKPFAFTEGGKTYTEHHGGCLTVALAELGDAQSDAAFIAAARSALPRLLDECERLIKDNAWLRSGHWADCAINHGGSECDMGPECGLRPETRAEFAALRKLLAEACSLLESDHRPFAPDGSRGTEQIEREARIAAIRREGGVE